MDLKLLEQEIGYVFKNKRLLIEAITHPSAEKGFSYERLEFLGDAILNMTIALFLYELFPSDDEGALSKKHSSLVCRDTLAAISKDINLGYYMIFSQSERCCGGGKRSSNLENALEAIIAAIYLDGGYSPVFCFVQKYWYQMARCVSVPPSNPKTMLQELMQSQGMDTPKYVEVRKTGPDHSPIFKIEVQAYGFTGSGSGSSKKIAEQKAAESLLKQLTK